MLISNLLDEIGIKDECQIIDECEFDVLARITTAVEGKKCIFLAEKKYIRLIPPTTAMIITNEELSKELSDKPAGLCICNEPKGIYFIILNHLAKKSRVKKPTTIGENCSISDKASVAAVDVVIGNNVTIEEFACVNEGSVIGDNCIIRAGAQVSVQDFNFFQYKGSTYPLEHTGATILGDNVDIGYHAQIGRALYEYSQTRIGDNCKIANYAAIGHDSIIGHNTNIYANVMIGGNVSIGNDSHIYMSSTIKNAISIGSFVKVNMGSVVLHDIADNKTVFGNPARAIVMPKL